MPILFLLFYLWLRGQGWPNQEVQTNKDNYDNNDDIVILIMVKMLIVISVKAYWIYSIESVSKI